MQITISRSNKKEPQKFQTFNIKEKTKTLLAVLEDIKENLDSSLTYRCGCKSGVCGSCAVRINGVEKLACKTKIKENDVIEPLQQSSVIKDLVVDLKHEHKVLKQSKAYLTVYKEETITPADEALIDRQSNCILCQSCYSSCPVYEVNKNFLGPYALTRTLRYINDKKANNDKNIIDAIQTNGVWDCTLCGNCTMVCPQFIDPKTDIMNLRMKSAQAGYEDPNMQNMGTINSEFNSGFDPSGGFGGFNPNGF